MLPQARPQTAGMSWIDVVQAHVRARERRFVGRREQQAFLDELRAHDKLSALHAAAYPDSDVLRTAPEVDVDVEPTRFVTSASSVSVGPLHRWMSAAWVEKRFWRSLHGAADGAQLTVLPLQLSALDRSFSAVVATDMPSVAATLLRLAHVGDAMLDDAAARVVAVSGSRVTRDERFICTSLDDRVLWSCGWYSGPTHVIEDAVGVGLPALAHPWAAPATVARSAGGGSPSDANGVTIAFVGGARDERLMASWARGSSSSSSAGGAGGVGSSSRSSSSGRSSSSRSGSSVGTRRAPASAQLLGDGPHWFASTASGLVCASPFAGCRLPLRLLRAPEAASVLARLHRSLLFINAAVTETGLPWWEERGGPTPGGEVIDWGGMTIRPGGAGPRRATHADASVIVPYELLRAPGEVERSRRSGDRLDAVVFVVEVGASDGLLLEARTWPQAIALAVGLDTLDTGHLRNPLALRSYPGDVGAGLQAWLDLGAERAPRAFVWSVPRARASAASASLPGLAPGDVTALVADAVRGHPSVALSALGELRATAGREGTRLDARAVVAAVGRALDELGSRCPPALHRAHHELTTAAEDPAFG